MSVYQRVALNIVWAAAMQWLLLNPTHALWWETTALVGNLGGIPDV